jgi:hypothetical protein
MPKPRLVGELFSVMQECTGGMEKHGAVAVAVAAKCNALQVRCSAVPGMDRLASASRLGLIVRVCDEGETLRAEMDRGNAEGLIDFPNLVDRLLLP